MARELGSERRKTVRSLSVVVVSKLRGHDLSTRDWVVHTAGVSVVPPGAMLSSYVRHRINAESI